MTLTDERLEFEKIAALQEVLDQFDLCLSEAVDNPSDVEQSTWTLKLTSAEAVIAGIAKPYQMAMISQMAAKRSLTVEDISKIIIEKNEAFHIVTGELSAEHDRMYYAVKNATSTTEVADLMNTYNAWGTAFLKSLQNA